VAEPNSLHQAPEARKNVAWAIGTEVDYREQWAPQAMKLPQAQAISTGAGVRVAVLDTGAELNHPALAGRLMPGRDFVDDDNDPSEVGGIANKGYGHGTHVAGLIALSAPGAKIMPLRVLDPDGMGDVWTLAEALVYAVDPDGNPNTDDGAHVINMSLGTLSKTQIFDVLSQIISCEDGSRRATRDTSDPGYNDDRSRCKTQPGAIVVVAAGNDASSTAKEYPAAESANGLLSVAASDSTRHIAGFSNFGGWIESVAPGDHITSAVPGGGYGTWSGTSMASPLAAGTAALLRALDLTARPKDLVPRIEKTEGKLCGTQLRQIDALAVLQNVTPPDQPCP
jgi:subtilisin family serine protease